VVAERSAGVRLVIARSFERIYRQNAGASAAETQTISAVNRTLDARVRGQVWRASPPTVAASAIAAR
jgi:aconitase A